LHVAGFRFDPVELLRSVPGLRAEPPRRLLQLDAPGLRVRPILAMLHVAAGAA
jgi:hypothetical protein